MSVTLLDIKTRTIPELDDEFAKDLEFEGLEALREKVRGDLRDHLEESSEVKIRREAAEVLIAATPMELPPGLVNQQVEMLVQEQRRQMDLLASLNKLQAESKFESGVESMEVAFRMQKEAPEVFDITKEPEKVRERYGDTAVGRGCLMARRMVEKGVRMVQIYHCLLYTSPSPRD